MDLTRRPAGKWIFDFGWSMSEAEAALYQEPYWHAKEHVHPMRQQNRREAYRTHWWRHMEPRQGMWRALDGLSRYIATPTVAKAPAVRLARRPRLPRPSTDRHCPRRRHGLRHPAQPVSRSMVAPARHQPGGSAALHAHHHLRDLHVPGRPLARYPRRRLRERSASRRHRRSRASVGRTARPLAEPARMGGMDGRAGLRLSKTSRRAQQRGGERAQSTHAHQPLQCPPAMARRCPCEIGRHGCGGFRLACGYFR